MSVQLPALAYTGGLRKGEIGAFYGVDRSDTARTGSLEACENLTSARFPCLAARKPRRLVRQDAQPGGLLAHNGALYSVHDGGLYRDGTLLSAVTAGEKTMIALGSDVLVLPDKLVCSGDTVTSAEAVWTGACTLGGGTFAGIPAEGCALTAAGADFTALFRVGDAVTLSGAAAHPANNKTVIIRELTAETMTFYENTFVTSDGGDAETMTVARRMPALEGVAAWDNRLWGYAGDTVYASALGDLRRWNVFDGLSTDSWTVRAAEDGDFTAIAVFSGTVLLFKENRIYKLYGSLPENFRLVSGPSLGVRAGCARSVSAAGERLYFLSPRGVAVTSGGTPVCLSGPLGGERFAAAVGGSDGERYYVSASDGAGQTHLYAYDDARSLWHREDGLDVLAFARLDGTLYAQCRSGALWALGDPPESLTGQTEAAFDSLAVLTPLASVIGGCTLTRVIPEAELEPGASLAVDVSFDGGQFQNCGAVTASGGGTAFLPAPIRRCRRFRLRLRGRGQWRLLRLALELTAAEDPR